MIGTSGPSISMMALSTPSPCSAASTCSAVEHSGPSASPSTVANSVAVTARTSARTSRSGPAVVAEAHEDDAGVRLGGKHSQGGWRAGMDADAADGGRGCEAWSAYRLSSVALTDCTHDARCPLEAQIPDFAGKRRKANLRQRAGPPPSPSKIPFCYEHFRRRQNHRQLTLSYQVLPSNRRKGAPKRDLSARPSREKHWKYRPFRDHRSCRNAAASQFLKH